MLNYIVISFPLFLWLKLNHASINSESICNSFCSTRYTTLRQSLVSNSIHMQGQRRVDSWNLLHYSLLCFPLSIVFKKINLPLSHILLLILVCSHLNDCHIIGALLNWWDLEVCWIIREIISLSMKYAQGPLIHRGFFGSQKQGYNTRCQESRRK